MKFKHQSRRRTAATMKLYSQERALVALATFFFVIAFMTYMYFLCVSVVNVVVRQEINSEITEVTNSINTLETRYLEAQGRVTKDEALARGFRDSHEKVYVTRVSENLVFAHP